MPGFFYTDAISDQAVAFIDQHAPASTRATPFFTYVAYTAPHWPLHAHDEDIAKYKGRFDAGWDALRAGAPRQARRQRHPAAALEAHRARPDAAAVDRGRADKQSALDAALHGGLCGADRPHGPGHRPHRRRARDARPARRHAGHLPLRQRRLRRGHPRGRDDRRARRQADDRASRTPRAASRCTSATTPAACRGRRTPTRATARRGPTCRTRRSACTSTGSTRAASRRR